MYNDACDDGNVSEGETEVHYECAFSGADQETCGAWPPSANVTKVRNESTDDTVRAGARRTDNEADLVGPNTESVASADVEAEKVLQLIADIVVP